MEPISVIISYMHSKDRYPLLIKCIESLRKYKPIDEVEICIHESGKKQYLKNLSDGIRYRFDKFDGMMHRGWSLNRGVRTLSTKDRIVLMDADIMVSEDWWNGIENVDFPCVAWSQLLCIDKKSTMNLIKGNSGEIKYEKLKRPSVMGAAGGIFYCPKDIFYRVKGVPEDFKGTWGGPDNSFLLKLGVYGYDFCFMNGIAFHLWHQKNLPRVRKKQSLVWDMLLWKKDTWDKILEEIGDKWGYDNAEYIDTTKYRSGKDWSHKEKISVIRGIK